MRAMEKRGQVSIFMIIAILLLLLTSFFIYIQKYAIQRQSEIEMSEGQNIEDDIASLNAYVESVARSSAQSTLVLWANSSGITDTAASGLPFEECIIDGKTHNLTYFYSEGDGYFDSDGNDEPEKDRLRQNLSVLAASRFMDGIDETVLDAKGFSIENSTRSQAQALAQFNDFTSLFIFSPNLRVSKNEFTTTFTPFPIEENASMGLIEDEIPFALLHAASNGNFDTYTPINAQKLTVCGAFAANDCKDPYSDTYDTGSANAHLITITLDESFGEIYPFKFRFLVDTVASGCS